LPQLRGPQAGILRWRNGGNRARRNPVAKVLRGLTATWRLHLTTFIFNDIPALCGQVPVFSYTFRLRPQVIRSGPLFSITFAHRSLNFEKFSLASTSDTRLIVRCTVSQFAGFSSCLGRSGRWLLASFGMGFLSKRRSFPSADGNPVGRHRIPEGLRRGFPPFGKLRADITRE
jgi:hypothetical protein